MADGELGNLRRAPRIVEDRIAHQTRYRTEGMVGGAFDAVRPVDMLDDIAIMGDNASTDDGGAGSPDWFTESLSLTSSAAASWTLTYYPVDFSEVISLNGVRLVESVDYTVADNVVTWVSVADLILGIGADTWTVTATYPYFDQAVDSWTPTALTSWQLNGVAAVSGSTVQLTNLAAGHEAGSAVNPIAVPSTWTSITVNATMFLNSAYGFAIGLLDSAVYADTFVGGTDANIGWLTGGSGAMLPSSSAWIGWATTFPANPAPRFWSNDGSTTYAAGVVGSAIVNTHIYEITWTVTSPNTATCTLTTDGVLTGSSTQWVPTSPFIAISAGTAGASNQQQITSATVTVI